MHISETISGGSGAFTPTMKAASGGFSDSLASALGGERSRAGQDPREAAEELVAITLIQPILAQLRESEMAAEPFAPSEGEKQFGALYDAEIARQMVQSQSFPLVDALARQMRERAANAEALASRGTEAASDDAARTAEHERIDRSA